MIEPPLKKGDIQQLKNFPKYPAGVPFKREHTKFEPDMIHGLDYMKYQILEDRHTTNMRSSLQACNKLLFRTRL